MKLHHKPKYQGKERVWPGHSFSRRSKAERARAEKPTRPRSMTGGALLGTFVQFIHSGNLSLWEMYFVPDCILVCMRGFLFLLGEFIILIVIIFLLG